MQAASLEGLFCLEPIPNPKLFIAAHFSNLEIVRCLMQDCRELGQGRFCIHLGC